jgi:hypothetical protein
MGQFKVTTSKTTIVFAHKEDYINYLDYINNGLRVVRKLNNTYYFNNGSRLIDAPARNLIPTTRVLITRTNERYTNEKYLRKYLQAIE